MTHPKTAVDSFVCANTDHGFFSLIPQLFTPAACDRIYILKGTPGSGKSTFLRTVAEKAELCGYTVERIRCSSDPASYDGVFLPQKKTVLFDGTAPHAIEPACPGGCEVIVDLYGLIDDEVLKKQKEKLRSLTAEKAAHWRDAYRLLSAAGELRQVRQELLLASFLPEKAERTAERMLRREMRGAASPRFRSAFCAEGIKTLPAAKSERTVFFSGSAGTEVPFFSVFDRVSRRYEIGGIRYLSVRHPAETEGMLTAGGTLYSVSDPDTADDVVSLRRFYDSERLARLRPKIRALTREEQTLRYNAAEELKEAMRAHFDIERLIGPAVDFEALERRCAAFCEKLFKSLEKV